MKSLNINTIVVIVLAMFLSLGGCVVDKNEPVEEKTEVLQTHQLEFVKNVSGVLIEELDLKVKNWDIIKDEDGDDQFIVFTSKETPDYLFKDKIDDVVDSFKDMSKVLPWQDMRLENGTIRQEAGYILFSSQSPDDIDGIDYAIFVKYLEDTDLVAIAISPLSPDYDN